MLTFTCAAEGGRGVSDGCSSRTTAATSCCAGISSPELTAARIHHVDDGPKIAGRLVGVGLRWRHRLPAAGGWARGACMGRQQPQARVRPYSLPIAALQPFTLFSILHARCPMHHHPPADVPPSRSGVGVGPACGWPAAVESIVAQPHINVGVEGGARQRPAWQRSQGPRHAAGVSACSLDTAWRVYRPPLSRTGTEGAQE